MYNYNRYNYIDICIYNIDSIDNIYSIYITDTIYNKVMYWYYQIVLVIIIFICNNYIMGNNYIYIYDIYSIVIYNNV